MTNFNSFLAICISAVILSACGGEDGIEAERPEASSSMAGLNAFARELVREDGCDPDIARAMAPYESDYGECNMPQFLDTCGDQNKAEGIQLISEIRDEGTEGLNPWLRSCVRSQDLRTSLNALCQARLRQTEEVCGCIVDATLQEETDRELLQWFTIAHAYDPNWQKGEYEEWGSMMSDNNRLDELESAKRTFYGQLNACKA